MCGGFVILGDVLLMGVTTIQCLCAELYHIMPQGPEWRQASQPHIQLIWARQ